MWKQRIIQAVWLLAGAGTVTLLAAAMQKKSAQAFMTTQVEIAGASGHVFVDEDEVQDILRKAGVSEGLSMNHVNLREAEEALEKDPWIANAELFFDNKRVLQVRISEREPVARIFTITGHSFYLDTTGKMLPLSEKLSARVPVFTNVPFSGRLSAADSALLKDVVSLSRYIVADSFWNAQVAQVNIEAGEFEILPVIGNHVISLGDARDLPKKFRKLLSFYRHVSVRAGFDAYEKISLVYNGQVVATRRGAFAATVDSAGAVERLQRALEHGGQMMQDSVIQQRNMENNRPAPRAVMPPRR